MTFDLHLGDCIDVMASLPAESVDAVITSPPYAEQRKATYGGVPEADYPEWSVRWMREAKRLLKPDGSVIINIAPHVKCGVVADYVLRTRLALRDDGWAELQELIWHKSNGMPTGSAARPRRTFEHLMWFGKHGRAWSNAKAGGTIPAWETRAGMTGRGRRLGWSHSDGGNKNTTPKIARVTDVAHINVGKPSNRDAPYDHPATYPWQLAEWCGKLICPPRGAILDPFNGIASTGVAAVLNGWHYIGIDAVPEYVDMSRKRLEQVEAEHAGR